jgi:hypothetical protein
MVLQPGASRRLVSASVGKSGGVGLLASDKLLHQAITEAMAEVRDPSNGGADTTLPERLKER